MVQIDILIVGESGPRTVQGFLVPDTEGLLAIDERKPETRDTYAQWNITHLPSGFVVSKDPYTIAHSREQAAAVAQGFYKQCKQIGVNLKDDPVQIIAAISALPQILQLRFWESVQVFVDEEALRAG